MRPAPVGQPGEVAGPKQNLISDSAKPAIKFFDTSVSPEIVPPAVELSRLCAKFIPIAFQYTVNLHPDAILNGIAYIGHQPSMRGA